jgi:hypothetical protein
MDTSIIAAHRTKNQLGQQADWRRAAGGASAGVRGFPDDRVPAGGGGSCALPAESGFFA